jgi:sporulation protein YlmC with PRC-barrel domain
MDIVSTAMSAARIVVIEARRAGTRKGRTMDVSTRKTEEMYGVVSASKIIGEAVVNRQGEGLGKIHELVIDAREGRLAYAVLSFGGFMGMGNKLFAMPWKAFEFANTENKLILNVDKVKLASAPGFDRDAKWPDFADRSWGGEIHTYYGFAPYWDM